MKAIEEDMEHSFKVQSSGEKQCGVCLETVLDKKPAHEARFGILTNCTHVFCLSCIRRWRSAQNLKKQHVRYVFCIKFNKDLMGNLNA